MKKSKKLFMLLMMAFVVGSASVAVGCGEDGNDSQPIEESSLAQTSSESSSVEDDTSSENSDETSSDISDETSSENSDETSSEISSEEIEDSSSEEDVEIPKTPLATPILQANGDIISWDAVENAAYYIVLVLPNNECVEVLDTEFSILPYYAGNKEVSVSVQAVAAEGEYADSSYSEQCTVVLNGEPITSYTGVGNAVNLLTGDYTQPIDGEANIFDKERFGQLRLEEDTSVQNESTSVRYSESLSGYLAQTSENAVAKTGMDTWVKVPAGYDLLVDAFYQGGTYENTTTIFYNMDYYNISKKMVLSEGNATEIFASILSEEFLADANKVGAEEMTAEAFIAKYGTHVIAEALYGGKFNVHYELFAENEKAAQMFGDEKQQNISAQISGALKKTGLALGIDPAESVSSSAFTSNVATSCQISFNATAVGGGKKDITNATSLDDFAADCSAWAKNLKDENSVLVDVPEGSLIFVWELLDDSYSEAKDILSEYFYAAGEESYYEIQDKESDIYQYSVVFDRESGILTANFTGLQAYKQENTGLQDVVSSYFVDNVFTVPTMVDGIEVKKVVFKGKYNTLDVENRLIETVFKDFSIVFDDAWMSKIVVEFDHFAFEAPAETVAMNFDNTESSTIVINVKGLSYVKGGDGGDGGNGGNVKKIVVCNELVDDNEVLSEIHGTVGMAGLAGAAGAAGVGGKSGTPSGGQYQYWGTKGTDGVAGVAGLAGIAGTTENPVPEEGETENPVPEEGETESENQ